MIFDVDIWHDGTPLLYIISVKFKVKEFNVPFQHKYIRDVRSQFTEDTVEPSVSCPGLSP